MMIWQEDFSFTNFSTLPFEKWSQQSVGIVNFSAPIRRKGKKEELKILQIRLLKIAPKKGRFMRSKNARNQAPLHER